MLDFISQVQNKNKIGNWIKKSNLSNVCLYWLGDFYKVAYYSKCKL